MDEFGNLAQLVEQGVIGASPATREALAKGLAVQRATGLDLVTWLRAALDAREREIEDDCLPSGEAAYVQADVDAKRRILDLHEPFDSHYVDGLYVHDKPGVAGCSHCTGLCHSSSGISCESPDAPWPCPTVRLVALSYAGRDGYRDEWTP